MIENRPSKKQYELLNFIDGFIKTNGYGPSYREVMRALDYRSVSTVAVHIDGLITRGLLRKTDNSARSLEVVSVVRSTVVPTSDAHIDWLEREVKKREDKSNMKEAETLKNALAILRKDIHSSN